MKHSLNLVIQPQPTPTSCGPTCLAAVYAYWDLTVDLPRLITDIGELGGGGTLAVNLACHALHQDFDAEIITYNLQLFDPTWFTSEGEMKSPAELSEKLENQLSAKRGRSDVDQYRLERATRAYCEFLHLGGSVRMQPLDEHLIVRRLIRETPILCGLSATYLYHESRERVLMVEPGCGGPPTAKAIADDVGGDPSGHFVVLHGYEPQTRTVRIADPLHPNPMAPTNIYTAPLSRVTSAILLGIVTYDANVLTISPKASTTN